MLAESCLAQTEQALFGRYTVSTNLGRQVAVQYKIEGEYAYFLFEKKAPGFLAFGIGKSMNSADIVKIEKVGLTVRLTDCYLAGHAAPKCSNASQRWELVRRNQTAAYITRDNYLKVEIRRLLSSPSDPPQCQPIRRGLNNFIFSYTTTDLLVKHNRNGYFGSVPIDLSQFGVQVDSQSSALMVQSVLILIAVFL